MIFNLILKILVWLKDLVKSLEPSLPPVKEIEFIPTPYMKSNAEKLLEYTITHLDEDISPLDLIKDELGCAESLSNLLQKVFPDFPIYLSTTDLFNKLKTDKRFKATLIPHKYIIVISPRSATQYGHCGIFITDEKIASNNSYTGKFNGYYSWDAWILDFYSDRYCFICYPGL